MSPDPLQPDTSAHHVKQNASHHALRRALLLGLPASLASPTLLAQAVAPGVDNQQVLLGQSIALQGGKNAYAAEAQAGIKACLDHANRTGGVLGRRVLLRTLDDENNSGNAEANARALVAGGVLALFGSLEGGPSTAVMKAAVDLKVPFIGPMAGSPGLRRPHQGLVFPVRAEHREEFRALMAQGRQVGLKQVALFHSDSDVGREHLNNVRLLAAELGIGFGGGLPFKGDIDEAGLDKLVATVMQQGVDLVINHGSAGVYEKLIRRANAASAKARFWAVNSGSSPLAKALGELARGMLFAQIVPNPRSGKTALVREYQQRMDSTHPGMALSYGSLEGYMTAKALLLALRAAGPALTRLSLIAGAQSLNNADLGGLPLRWKKGDHLGSTFVDLALVDRHGQFLQ
jgi:branched-chain amino acid transport system substrate-binding protein